MSATMSLLELARALPAPARAARWVASQLLSPEEPDEPVEADEWVTEHVATARRLAGAGSPVVLRLGPGASLCSAPALPQLSVEAVVSGPDADAVERAAQAVVTALAAGVPVRAVLCHGATGIDCYRAALVARRRLGARLPIRVRWDGVLDVKGAALALSFGADELAGPLAEPKRRFALAQLGGPPEDAHRPSPAHVEALIVAAGRRPTRRG